MEQQNQREENYQVLLMGIEDETEERKDLFWRTLSERYHVSLSSLRDIMSRSPVVLAGSLSLDEARHFAERLKPLGARVSIDRKNDRPTMSLEFQDSDSALVALEVSTLRKTQTETWSVTGRVKNISAETLHDVWVLIQLFGSQGDFLTFEEVPLPLNPLPSQSSSPFKVIFEGSLVVKSVAITFKNSGGRPLPSTDQRKSQVDESLTPVALKEASLSDLPAGDSERRMDEEQPNPINPAAEQEKDVEESPTRAGGSAPVEEADVEPSAECKDRSPSESGEDVSIVALSSSTSAILAKTDVEMIDVVFPELKPSVEPSGGNGQEVLKPTPALEEASQLLKEITESTPQEVEEKPIEEESTSAFEDRLPPFPYLEEFRQSIETYDEAHRNHFVEWMEAQGREEGVQGTLRCLVTLLVHARFDQMTRPEKALENTRKVAHVILQPTVSLDEIPSLEGTRHFSGDQWKLLFHRALPRIQSIAHEIEAKKQWNARELERLIQIIPHMSPKTSRSALRVIQRLRIQGIEIDFSQASLLIGKALYRVAARLGVVDSQFDYYEGPKSMGDMKIQAFARTAFPEDPLRVEEPMNWVGGGTPEDGGACAPTSPRCEGCLFSGFCPRHCVHLDPSEKGMRGAT